MPRSIDQIDDELKELKKLVAPYEIRRWAIEQAHNALFFGSEKFGTAEVISRAEALYKYVTSGAAPDSPPQSGQDASQSAQAS
jgi:hypothetical protein